MTPILEIDALHAWYGKSHVLRGVDLSVGEGEIVALLGRNGSGRSTAMKAIVGEVERRGKVAFKGSDIASLPTHRIARLGVAYVPENRDIFPNLTVAENLVLGLKSRSRAGRWAIDDFYDLFPVLRERRDAPGAALSGGEQQILTMCRALLGDPDLILVDEPTEGLSPIMVKNIADLLGVVSRRGVSILLVEQKLTIALRLAGRVYVMGHGDIVFEGSPDALRANRDIQSSWLEV